MATDIKKTTISARKDQALTREAASEYPLGRRNFLYMIIAAILIVGGFLLMLGGSSTDEFNPDIFSVRRIVVGPTIAFIGFVSMAVAIILKPSKSDKKF